MCQNVYGPRKNAEHSCIHNNRQPVQNIFTIHCRVVEHGLRMMRVEGQSQRLQKLNSENSRLHETAQTFNRRKFLSYIAEIYNKIQGILVDK